MDQMSNEKITHKHKHIIYIKEKHTNLVNCTINKSNVTFQDTYWLRGFEGKCFLHFDVET